MERFNLGTWLEDKSRKVIDDDGFPVEIIKWDANEKCPVVLLNHNGIAYNVSVDGMYDSDPNHGLFFADEEEELTEIQKTLEEDCDCYVNLYNDGKTREELREWIKSWCPRIIDLARKEVEKEITKEVEQKAINHTYAYQNGYENGKYDALKDLPKWKKAEKLDCHVAIQQNDRVVLSDFVQKDEYYITLDVLKKLPKEE